MAQVLPNGQIKLDNGQTITGKQGEWYDGQHYFNGAFGGVNVVNDPNAVGYGQQVSQEVIGQSAAAQGKSPQELNTYLAGQAKKMGQNFNPTSNSIANNASLYGGSGGSGAMAAPGGSIDLQSIYDKSMNTPEIQELNSKIAALDADINTRKERLNEATTLINDNPFYAETTREGRERKLNESAGRDINTKIEERNALADSLAKMKAEAEVKVNLATKQYDINRQEYKDNLERLNFLISSGAINNASGEEIAQLAVATGVSPSMIDSIVQTNKASNAKTQLITTTDDNGNLTIVAVDANTGEILNTNSLKGVGNRQGSGSGSSKVTETDSLSALNQYVNFNTNDYGHIDPAVWKESLNAFMADGLGTRDDFIKSYAAYTDPNRGDFSKAYGFSLTKREELTGDY